MKLKAGSIIGTFGKGIAGSLSVNFGLSGGANCDIGCKHHPESTASAPTFACYAIRVEKRGDRKPLAVKLARHEAMPAAQVCGKALLEIQARVDKGHRVPWVRISTNGSLPQVDDVTPLFVSQFRALLSYCNAQGIPVHCPIETVTKSAFYRKLVGDLVTIRESADDRERFVRARGAVSCSAGKPGTKYRERIDEARTLAARKRRRSPNRKVVVCPAVLNSFLTKMNRNMKNDRAKCGVCTACADSQTDIIYPLH